MNFNSKRLIDYYLGNLIVFSLILPMRIAKTVLRPKYSLKKPNHVVFIKMLGGGSVFLALPSILALRKKHVNCKMTIICSERIKAFAEVYGVFGNIVTIRDGNILLMIWTTLIAIFRTWMWRVDTVVDLEVHSRLTSCLSVFLLTPNRIGFVDDNSRWRKYLYTHVLYFNVYGPVYTFYDGIAVLLGVKDIHLDDQRKHFNSILKDVELNTRVENLSKYIVIGPECSEHGRERQLSLKQWGEVLRLIWLQYPALKIVLIGKNIDSACFEKEWESSGRIVNLCGQLSLLELFKLLQHAYAYIGIDSAPLHFARMLSPKVISIWGPTDPRSRLRLLTNEEEILYNMYPCSPCIHIAEQPPCKGNNDCMADHQFDRIVPFLAKPQRKIEGRASMRNLVWAEFCNYRKLVRLEFCVHC